MNAWRNVRHDISKVHAALVTLAIACAMACSACSDRSSDGQPITITGGQGGTFQPAGGSGGAPVTPQTNTGGTAPGGSSGAPPTPPADAGGASGMPSTPPTAGNAAQAGADSQTMTADSGVNDGSSPTGTGGTGVDAGMTPFTGPEDGDPNAPTVEIPGVPCGPMQGVAYLATPPTVQITGREVVVLYPCAHEGAAVTFFLLLHGTVQGDMKVPFTMNAFAIHELVDSHNVIVVVPTAVGSQWGNGDNGQDLPHLYEVVDWVYDTFGQKFNIRSMWAQGGSWGAFYLSTTFACDPRFEGRLKGVQLVVGGGCPRCSGRLSCQVAQQELEKGGGSPVSDAEKEALSSGAGIDAYATQHGCDPKTGPQDVGPAKYWSWPNCDPGWVHSYFLGPGNHADAWDRAVVLKMTEEMKSTEQ